MRGRTSLHHTAAPEDRQNVRQFKVNKEPTSKARSGRGRGPGKVPGCWEDPAADGAGPRGLGNWPWAALALPAGAPSVPFLQAASPEASRGSARGHRSEGEGTCKLQAAWHASFPADAGFQPRGSSQLGGPPRNLLSECFSCPLAQRGGSLLPRTPLQLPLLVATFE